MAKLAVGEKVEAFKDMVRTDTTTNRVKNFVVEGTPKLPSATAQYFIDKVPIVQWLPRYHISWLLTDAIAGLTIGVMLIPQGLAYAKIATIPIENGLYSSWIPAAVCVFMGTSKDLSTGPTSILGLLTAEIVRDLSDEYDIAAIANAVSFMVGVYSLAIGVLGLGFLLDYVSVPVLTGFISATALIIGMGQVGNLVGLSGVPDGLFNQIGHILKHLPEWDGPTCGIGIGTIVVLLALEKVGKTWGKKHFVIKYIASSRSIIALVIFTLISYLVNKNRDDPLWGISKVNTHGIIPPKAHDTGLIAKVATRAVAPLVACTLEHLAVGKAFGRKNGYAIDESQEFNYLGVTNLVNSFFGAMPVGGAMSRTAVNSECGVRSPLNGIVTAAWILLTIYVFSPALFWLPKATLSAIIIMAVVHLFGPVSLFYRFWRISFADFVASMACFWVTIFVSAEIGIGCGAAWSVVWTMLRSAFVKPAIYDSSEEEGFPVPQRTSSVNSASGDQTEHAGLTVPSDTVVIHFSDSIFYPNAHRGKRTALEAIKLVYDKVASEHVAADRERSWSVAFERRVERLRKQHNIVMKETPLAIVVWDFNMVSFVDVTAILALGEMKQDIRIHSGKAVQFRIVGMCRSVRERFIRAQWKLDDLYGGRDGDADVVYPSLEKAVLDREGSILEAVTIGNEKTGTIENEKTA
jgi:sodium-independent sulfate anion transporter 11